VPPEPSRRTIRYLLPRTALPFGHGDFSISVVPYYGGRAASEPPLVATRNRVSQGPACEVARLPSLPPRPTSPTEASVSCACAHAAPRSRPRRRATPHLDNRSRPWFRAPPTAAPRAWLAAKKRTGSTVAHGERNNHPGRPRSPGARRGAYGTCTSQVPAEG